MRLFHIAPTISLQAAQGTETYTPATFEAEGFIHCSYAEQVCAVANRLFRGRADLVLIEIDPAKLDCAVVDENLEGGSERYPHVYGALPFSAMVSVHAFPCRADGLFELPL